MKVEQKEQNSSGDKFHKSRLEQFISAIYPEVQGSNKYFPGSRVFLYFFS